MKRRRSATTTVRLPPANREYRPFGRARDLFECRAPEVLISGPAGTGKSLACLYKLHAAALLFPGLRALMVRKTRVSLTEAALVTFERHVLPEGAFEGGPGRGGRHSYQYANGSEIITGGIDRPGRIMSTEFDLVYVQEAIELTEEDWDALSSRLRNLGDDTRGRRLPYRQLMADTNPSTPTHWLKRRCDAGRCVMLESRHEDNPTLWDGAGWTEGGVEYIARLDNLSGPRLQRLRFGRWVQSEGIVYEGYDPAIHLVDPFPVPVAWPRYWAVDFGFNDPFVWQCWAVDPDGNLLLEREIYQTQTLVEDHAKAILAVWARQCADAAAASEGGTISLGQARERTRPRAVICDHDAEDRQTLGRHLSLGTTLALKDVSPGIQAVAARLRLQGNGKPRLQLLRGACVERDRALDAARRPCSTAEEFDAYVWDTKARDEGLKEVPLDRDDHGMDAMRYMVMHLDGPRQRLKVW